MMAAISDPRLGRARHPDAGRLHGTRGIDLLRCDLRCVSRSGCDPGVGSCRPWPRSSSSTSCRWRTPSSSTTVRVSPRSTSGRWLPTWATRRSRCREASASGVTARAGSPGAAMSTTPQHSGSRRHPRWRSRQRRCRRTRWSTGRVHEGSTALALSARANDWASDAGEVIGESDAVTDRPSGLDHDEMLAVLTNISTAADVERTTIAVPSDGLAVLRSDPRRTPRSGVDPCGTGRGRAPTRRRRRRAGRAVAVRRDDRRAGMGSRSRSGHKRPTVRRRVDRRRRGLLRHRRAGLTSTSSQGVGSYPKSTPTSRSSRAVKVRCTSASKRATPRSFAGSIVSRLAPNDAA